MLYKKLKSSFKDIKTKFVLACLFLIIDDLSFLPISHITGKTIDYLKKDNIDINTILSFISLILIVTVISYISYVLFGYLSGKSATNLKIYFKEKIYRSILRKSPEFFDKTTSGDILTLANSDTEFIYNYFTFGILQLIDSTVIPIVYILYLSVFVSFKLTMSVIFPFTIIIIVNYFLSKFIYKLQFKVNENYGQASQEILEIIEGIKIIRSYVNEKVKLKEFSKIVKTYYDLVYLQLRYSYFMWGINGYIANIPIAIGFIYGIYLIKNGEITQGSLVEFFWVLGLLSWSFNAMGMHINEYKLCVASFERINKLLIDRTEVLNGNIEFKEFSKIEFKNFNFSYPNFEKNSLNNISFAIKSGETLGIVGKSGSGKTTLIKQFLRLYNFEKEKIFIDEIPYENYELSSVRKNFGYVSQESIILSRSIKENILFGIDEENEEKMISVLKDADLYKDIEKFNEGLDTVVGERGLGLSGGQRQRISLARALYRNTSILILDDSFSALDADTENRIVNFLRNSRKDKTNIIVSHRLSAVQHSNKIIVLDDGKIVQQGTHNELINIDGWYKEQFEYQSLNGGV